MFFDVLKKKLNAKDEILSGLTVALALIPEAIAFSFVAGVSPLVGLYAAFIMGLITAVFGGRPGMISGATGSMAVVFVALVSTYGTQYLFATVILVGIIQILIGVFKLGKFARIIPHPVMLGFVNGLAIVIFRAQLGQFKVDVNGKSMWMTGSTLYIMLGLVILTMLIIYFLPKLTKAVPSSLAAIITVTLISLWLSKSGFNIPNVKDFAKGGISGAFPQFSLPKVPFNLKTLEIIFPFALTAALVGLIESLLTLTLIDELTDTRGRSNKECIGQGAGNMLCGVFGGMGGCAMIGQSIINVTSGGRKRLSGIVAAISLLLFVMFGSSLIEIIPLAALVGVMFMVVIGTFEWESLKLGNKIPLKDVIVIIIVMIITVVHDLALAVIVGVILSALIFAWEKGKQISATIFMRDDGIKVYRLDGPLFFASATCFKNIFDIKNDPKEIMIDFKNSHIMDHSAIEAINSITKKYKENNKKLHLKHLSPDCLQLLNNAEEIIDVNILEDPKYYIADDTLA
ncbi:SulP family inorganic anion transporter [Haliovirga abyssi]|uniref:Sodium-independent anion transporter n=1 Tax=Haliovirga abyssi TaxID=2996794 RepID=A0AAU9DSG2_9FUSO|nr:SulP family inorganic anion transporter [Haliovirga abyssi]BDU51568.1 sodium-independent anion transporter [Haliovirga abyssi]